MDVKYAVNLVSLMHLGFQRRKFPGCCFAPPERLIEDALEIGYDGVQALPIRGLTGEEKGIILFEDAWNAVPSLWHGLRHKTGASGMPSCINDWVVSPHPKYCREVSERLEERGIVKVSHRFDFCKRHLVEVHPGLDMTPELIVAKCETTGQRLVLDNEHLIRGYTASEIAAKPERAGKKSPLGDWEKALPILAPYVDVIHYHPPVNPVPLAAIAICAIARSTVRLAGERPIIMVAEHQPILKPRQKSIDRAKKVLLEMQIAGGRNQ